MHDVIFFNSLSISDFLASSKKSKNIYCGLTVLCETKRNETKRNGTLRNGTLRNGTLRNGTLRNGYTSANAPKFFALATKA